MTENDNSSPLSLADDPVSYFRSRATAQNTKEAYTRDLQHFIAWGGFLPGWQDGPMVTQGEETPGTPPAQLARYLADHAWTYKIATLRRRVAAINRWNATARCSEPGKHEAVRSVLAGIAREHARATDASSDVACDLPKDERQQLRVKKAPALRSGHIRAVLDVLDTQDDIRSIRDRALFLAAWALGQRVSEFLRVQVEDLELEESGVWINIGHRKNDQEGKGHLLPIPRIGGRSCAVEALECWLAAANIESGPVFRGLTRGGRARADGLHPDSINRVIQLRLKEAQIPRAASFTSHSFRAGMITESVQGGADARRVQDRSGHRDRETFEDYIRGDMDEAGYIGENLKRLS